MAQACGLPKKRPIGLIGAVMKKVDVVVIGAGPGGYSAAMRAAQTGLEVVCVEREAVGGVCLNWGCVPSKALITVAERYHQAKHGESFGVFSSDVRVDMKRAQTHNRAVVAHHTGGVAGLLDANRVQTVYGEARFKSAREVVVESSRGTETYQARRAIVVSTGAKPRVLPGFTPDGKRVLTAKEAVFLEQVPEHLVVLGGGVIGLELGSAYQTLGAKLTVVELGNSLLPGVDDDLVAVVSKRLVANGATVHVNARATAFDPTEQGGVLSLQTPTGTTTLAATSVLVAAGFVPNTRSLNVEGVGLAVDHVGHLKTGVDCQTSVPGIYAIGDVAGPPYLAHKAFAEALVVTDAITGKHAQRDWKAIPAAIFTSPEIATVGLSEREARSEGLAIEIGRFPYSALARAGARGENDGFVKLLSVEGRLVGAGLVGAEASELIAELTLAIEVGATLEDLSLTIHPHPTFSEGIHDAADHGLGRAVHVLNRRRPTPSSLSTASSLPMSRAV